MTTEDMERIESLIEDADLAMAKLMAEKLNDAALTMGTPPVSHGEVLRGIRSGDLTVLGVHGHVARQIFQMGYIARASEDGTDG